MEQLGINPAGLLAQVVNFGLLFWILYRVAYKPILRVLDERTANAKATLLREEESKREREQIRAEVASLRSDAIRQGQEIVARSSEAADRLYREAEERAGLAAAEFLAKAREEIAREREKAVSDIRKQTAELAILAAGTVIQKSLSSDDHFRLVEEALADAERSAAGHRATGA